MTAPKNRPNKPVVSLTLDEELIKKIDQYQHKNMIRSRSKAVTKLLILAFDVLKEDEQGLELANDPLEELSLITNIMNELIEQMKKKKEG